MAGLLCPDATDEQVQQTERVRLETESKRIQAEAKPDETVIEIGATD